MFDITEAKFCVNMLEIHFMTFCVMILNLHFSVLCLRQLIIIYDSLKTPLKWVL